MVRSKGDKIFGLINGACLLLLAIVMIYPFWEVIRISLSSPGEAAKLKFSLWPSEIYLDAYKQVFQNEYIWKGYFNTITVRILLGMPISLVLMILTAYPLSKKNLPMRNFFTMFIVFTMFFSGGMIPGYLLMSELNLIDTVWALVLPGAIPTFNMLILRNNFMALPESLEESAKIDGAGTIKMLMSIVLPLSKPILMTVILWGLVGGWNAWFDCLLYIREPDDYVLQVVLRKIIIDAAPQILEAGMDAENVVSADVEIIKNAAIIVSTAPILVAYPFLQKYFVKGMMVGSLKG